MNDTRGSSYRHLAYLAQTGKIKEKETQSATGSSQTLTVSAPGSGKAIVIESVRARYSDNSNNIVTVNYTDRDGTSNTFTVRTDNVFSFSPPGNGGVTTQENTEVTIDVPASPSNETSVVRISYSVVDEHLI